jgi:hypothetical protein
MNCGSKDLGIFTAFSGINSHPHSTGPWGRTGTHAVYWYVHYIIYDKLEDSAPYGCFLLAPAVSWVPSAPSYRRQGLFIVWVFIFENIFEIGIQTCGSLF